MPRWTPCRQASALRCRPDTVQRIGADAFNNDAVAACHQAARPTCRCRCSSAPGPRSGLVREFSDTAKILVEAFRPGGLSIVVPRAPSLPWNLGDTRGTVLLRMPNQPLALELAAHGRWRCPRQDIPGNPLYAQRREREAAVRRRRWHLPRRRPRRWEPSTIVDISGPQPGDPARGGNQRRTYR